MTARDRILDGLNQQQQQAVSADEGPILVMAGPGSGKTRVLTHRIAYLVQVMGIPAWRIMAVTFTNKAAREMQHRVNALLEESGALDGLTIGTFHAICARILRQEADHTAFSREYTIFDTADQLQVMKQVLAELNLDTKKHNPRAMLNKVSAAKNELIGPEDYPAPDYREEIVLRIYQRYNELLRDNNARDFDDLLMHTVELFRANGDVLDHYQRRYRHILVDEFQDTNTAQYVLVRLLAGERRNLFAVGDPDQSIYAFRGADYRNVQRFQSDYEDTTIILLEQNYRSHQAILDAATGVIDKNPGRVRKELFSDRKEGPLLYVYEAHTEDDEAHYVVETIAGLVAEAEYEPGDFAIMYRTNAQSRALEEAFLRAGMPYRLVGATRFYARREIKDVLAYLRLIHNPDDRVSLDRIINVPPRGVGQKTYDELMTWAERERLTPSEALFALLDEDTLPPMSTRAINVLQPFASELETWLRLRDELSVEMLLTDVLKKTGYLHYLDDGTPEGESRIENVMELRTVAASYGELSLTAFLEEVSLVSDVDDRPTSESQAPSLLTLHSAKGLEFPVVFIVGLEEGVLPHMRAIDDPEQMQEERRLMYVGLTRAQERLYLVYAFRRSLYGDSRANMPSRFLYDIPAHVRDGALLRPGGSASAQSDAYERSTSWDRASSRERRSSRSGRDSKPRVERPPTFQGGTMVWHAKYGEGVVVRSTPRGDMEEVDVLFPGIGQKTILADFLKPIES